MHSIRLVEGDEWQSQAPRFLDYNYCQFFGYAQKAAQRSGARAENVLILDGAEVIGAAAVRILKLGPLPFGVAYVRGGPICKREGVIYEEAFRACVQALVAYYVRDAGLVLKIIPPYRPLPELASQAEILQEFKFKAAVAERPHRTILKSIAMSDDLLERSLHSKWRRNLRVSLRSNLSLVSGTSDELFEQFEALYVQLRQLKKFSVDQDASFFRSVQGSLAAADKFMVHIALHDGLPVSGYVGSVAGDAAVYLFGASSEAGREIRAGYWLHWHVMRFCRDQGTAWYDLGGIDPVGNPDVYHFKSNMGGDEITANGPVEVTRGLTGRAFGAAISLVRLGLLAARRH